MDNIDIKKRYSSNPFVGVNEIRTKKKNILIGNSENKVLLDTETGELQGTTVATYREVDDAMFVKLFTQNIGLTFGLSSNGVKTLTVLINEVQKRIGTDVVTMDKYTHESFIEDHPDLKMAYVTFAKGLNELVKSQIIARARRLGDYYINPNFMFNGDRIRFVTEIRRKKKTTQEQLEERGQQRLINDD